MNVFFALLIAIILVGSYVTYDGYVSFQKAAARRDATSCNGIVIGQFRDACFAAVGIGTLNASLCRKPTDKDEQNRCLGVVDANTTLCEKIISDDKRDFCIVYVAMRMGDKQLCGMVIDLDRRRECQQKVKPTTVYIN
jgi:hypothetical protein